MERTCQGSLTQLHMEYVVQSRNGNLNNVSDHLLETWACCLDFSVVCITNMSPSLDIYDDGTVIVWDNVFIACVV